MDAGFDLPKDGPLPDKCSAAACTDDGSLTIMHRHDGQFYATVALLSGDVLTLVCGECDRPVERLRVTGTVRFPRDEKAD